MQSQNKHRRRGRPAGTTGRAAVLTPEQIKLVFRIARTKERFGLRAETIFAMSVGLGLRAKELASLMWLDVYDHELQVRPVLHLKAAYTKGAKTRDVFLASPQLRHVLETYQEKYQPWLVEQRKTPLFRSQKGGAFTAGSMARLLKSLYREAGIPQASSHSGRRTMITTLAEKGIDLKAIAEIAGHSSIRTTAMYVEANPQRLARILQEMRW